MNIRDFGLIITLLLFAHVKVSGGTLHNKFPTSDTTYSVNGANLVYEITCNEKLIFDTTSAKKIGDDCWIYKSKADLKNGGILLQLRAFKKTSENIKIDLDVDIDSYKKDFGEEFEQRSWHLPVKLKYVSALVKSKTVYQYIAYINPGVKSKFGLSLAINSIQALNDEDAKAIAAITESLTFSDL